MGVFRCFSGNCVSLWPALSKVVFRGPRGALLCAVSCAPLVIPVTAIRNAFICLHSDASSRYCRPVWYTPQQPS